MVLEDFQLLPLDQWLPGALVNFGITIAVLAVLGLLCGYLLAAARNGPLAGGDVTYRVIATGLRDLFRTSPRRIWALAWLAIRESLRRKVLVVFGVFLALMLFAGWFIEESGTDPAKMYLGFVLTATNYLILLLVLFLSVFSLPADIKSRTIYTIVTKPVHASEIVLGRILGFVAVATMVLAAMGIASYIFVVRSVSHPHEVVDVEELGTIGEELPDTEKLRTSTARNHRHAIVEDVDGNLSTDYRFGHWHPVTRTERPGHTDYDVAAPQGILTARVPIYGSLSFLDRDGRPTDRGVNTGSEWGYRSYIEGGTLAAAIWRFDNLRPEAFPPEEFPDGIPLEMTLRVFRTHKGFSSDQKEIPPIPGSIVLRNPITGEESAPIIFQAKEFYTEQLYLDYELEDTLGNRLTLFKQEDTPEPTITSASAEDSSTSTENGGDPAAERTAAGKRRVHHLVHNGQLEVQINCLGPAQYLGMAQGDLWLKARDTSYAFNFFKAYVGIWIQMVLVTGLGVMFSTYLNAAVSMLATLGAIVVGFFASFVVKIAEDVIVGGGPVESFIRLLTQKNVTSELEDTLGNRLAQTIDQILLLGMQGIGRLLPDFRSYDLTRFVAEGFNIPAVYVAQSVIGMFAYLIGVFIIGFFLLKTREIAK